MKGQAHLQYRQQLCQLQIKWLLHTFPLLIVRLTRTERDLPMPIRSQGLDTKRSSQSPIFELAPVEQSNCSFTLSNSKMVSRG